MSKPANPAMRDGSQDAEKGTQQVPGGAVKGETEKLSVGLASSVPSPSTTTGILKGLSAWMLGTWEGLHAAPAAAVMADRDPVKV